MTDDRDIIKTLLALADLIIPGACETGFSDYLNAGDVLDELREGAARLMAEALEVHGRDFAELDEAQRLALVEAARRRQFRFISAVVRHVVEVYYRDGRVLAALGLEARPPFPLGHVVEEGDFGLLEAVYERGIRYRSMRID